MRSVDKTSKKVPATAPESRNDQGFLAGDAEPTLETSTCSNAASAAGNSTGRKSFGRYELVQRLGAGGMGEVWLAEQIAPVRRRVAVKLIKAGAFDESVLRRFQSERQSLAIMDHPAIAKVFDAGTTPEGQPITHYCDQRKLKIRQRLELFVKVCEGVQHAHQKAIIHRDLKPANILVVEIDGKPQPRIIDFGIAKAVAEEPGGGTLFTQVGVMVGTPGYMSPEQADSGAQDVDTRTDVYSLGVVLYELLTGFLPFDPKRWQKQPLHLVLRQLREDDPPRPSTKVSTEKAESGATAERRCSEPAELAGLLRGDLDWVTMKALEKDRVHRYGTPSELAADLGRYLADEPVAARPASASYRFQKYVRRHRLGVAVAASLGLLVLGFAIMQSVEMRRVTRERDRANRIAEFMTSMFKAPDPGEAHGKTVTAREVLDKASKSIEVGLAKDPQLQAKLSYTMGDVYQNLGLYRRSEAMLDRAFQIQRRVLGPNDPDTLESLDDLGWTLQGEGRYREAEKLLRESLEGRRRILGAEHPKTLYTMSELAWTLLSEGRRAEAEKLYRQALDGQRRVLGPEDAKTLNTMDGLAWTLMQGGHYAQAEKLLRETLDTRRRLLGPEDENTLGSLNKLGNVLEEEGRYAEAEKLLRLALAGRRKELGPEHPHTLNTMMTLGATLYNEGEYAGAVTLFRECYEIRRRTLGPEDRATLEVMSNLSLNLGKEGQYAEAEKLSREEVGISRRGFGGENPLTAVSVYNLAVIVLRRGFESSRRQKALALLRHAVDHGLAPDFALFIEKDPDLKPLHGDPRFESLVAHVHQSVASARR